MTSLYSLRSGLPANKLTIRAIVTVLLLCFLCLPLHSWGQSDNKQLKLLKHLKKVASENSTAHDRFDAEVWLIDMSERMIPFIKNSAQRFKLLKQIHYEASRVKLPPEIILAVIQTESAFDHYAISSAGAQGLMQVMPFWKKEIGRPADNLTSINTNLRYGCTILSFYLKKEKGNLTRALARYNGSLGQNWYPERVYSNLVKYWQ